MKYLFSFIWMLLFCVANAQEEDYISLQDRLKSNIFLKVDASNTDCFVGEPIIVTYKLYSALATESNIVKNPYFEGFDVKDLKGGADHMASRETVDGVRFDVHTLLKLQLTPRRAGRLILGSLVVQNRVKLVDSRGNEDPILDGVEEGYTLNNGYFTLPVSSVPITVLVTALPGGPSKATSQPNGLVGDFKMDVQLSKKLLAPGEQAQLTIMLTGRGDFSKIEQPEIAWPEGADVLAAQVDEDGSAYKSFTIPFSMNAPGKFTIPAIRFSFFDATSSRYKTITNIPVEFSVVREGGAATTGISAAGEDNSSLYLWISIALLVVVAITMVLLLRFRKKKMIPQPPSEKMVKAPVKEQAAAGSVSVNQALQEAKENRSKPGSGFSIALKQGIFKYLEARWGLPSQSYNEQLLREALHQHAVPPALQAEFLQLIATIDMNIYSGGGAETDRTALWNEAYGLLHQI